MNYIIDLDGTLMTGDKAINSSPEFIKQLKLQNSDFLIMTNSVKPPAQQAARLKAAGMAVPEDRIINPIAAINALINEKGFSKVSVVGSKKEKEQIKAGLDDTHPELVILLDFEREDISYSRMQQVFTLLQKGIPAVSASYSDFYLKGGIRYLDTGSFTKLFEAACGRKIPVLGKPSKEYFRIAKSLLNRGGLENEEIAVIGDDWSTDIKGAEKAGLKGVLTRSGKYKAGDERRCKPSRTIQDLTELIP